jgi:hypothetical protein
MRRLVWREGVIWLRRDALALVMYAVVLAIMTYPLLFQLREILPLNHPDTYAAMYQNWWMRETVLNGYDLNDSPLLFHPNGMDLTLQPRRYTTLPLWWLLYELLGEPTAYNLTVLIQLWVRAYTMYLFLVMLVRHRAAAWIGGALYAFAARSLSIGLCAPDTGSTEFIPLFMLAFVTLFNHIASDRALSRREWCLRLALAVLAFSANVYMNLKIGVFAAIIGFCYLAWMCLVRAWWRRWQFWATLAAFAAACLIVGAPQLVSSFSAVYIGSAVYEFSPSPGVDLLSFIKPDMFQPLFVNQFIAQFIGVEINEFHQTSGSYLGFSNLLLGGIGALFVVRRRRRELLWLLMALWFWGLSLGVTATINLQPIDWYWTPYRLVEGNPIFVVLRNPFRFSMLLWFPFAVLIAYGLRWLDQRLPWPKRVRWISFVILCSIALFEVSSFPIAHRSAAVNPVFYSDIWADKPGAVITLPMGRQNAKHAMYAQIWHRQPIQEGFIGRMPPDAYDYIEANPVLNDWQDLDTLSLTLQEWTEGIDALLADGFRYLVVHKYVEAGQLLLHTSSPQRETHFSQSPVVYEDLETRVIELAVLREHPPRTLLEEH